MSQTIVNVNVRRQRQRSHVHELVVAQLLLARSMVSLTRHTHLR